MKVWKIAVKPKYYGVPTEGLGGHDYDPSWDYEEDVRPKRKMMKAFQQAAQYIADNYMNHFEGAFTRFRISFVKNAGGGLATYANGTYEEPVVMIDLRLCAKTQEDIVKEFPKYKNEYTLYQIALTTLLHELRHAWPDWMGHYNEKSEEELEDDAESFGKNLAN